MTDDTADDTNPLHVVSGTGAAGWSGTALRWSAARAARETGAARSTILEALKSGRLEGSKDDHGAWQIEPQALATAGFNPGKPTPPDSAPAEGRDETLVRLRLELAEVRADARVAVVEREAERRMRESAERERDTYRRMLEAPTPPVTSSQPAPDPTPTPDSISATGGDKPKTGRFRRAWNVYRYS